MASIKSFFSPSKTPTKSPVKDNISTISIPKADQKLIASNMKSVINSVKIKKKARKRKRNVNESPEIHDISNILKSNLSFISPSRHELGNDLNDTSIDISVTETCAGNENKSVSDVENGNENSSKENNSFECDEGKSQSKLNAFEFMMTARNKVIGSNTPGKEIVKQPSTPETSVANAKRRLLLEEWADRKGGAQKKLDEAACDAYIDKVMKKRKKRLKLLLKNGKKKKDIESSDEEIIVPATKRSKRKIPKAIQVDSSDSEIDLIGSSAQNDNFLVKLSSPLKKRDSLLGYFNKLTKTPSSESTCSNSTLPKKRGRPRKTIKMTDNEISTNLATELSTPTTSNVDNVESKESRPKRLCRDRQISYFIEQDFESSKSSSRKPKSIKLAPIFNKTLPKNVIDPAIQQARHDFLMSGMPEKMKLEMEKLRQFEELHEIEYEVFPKISHVGLDISFEDGDNRDFIKSKIRFRCDIQNDNDCKRQHNQLKLITIEKVSEPCDKEETEKLQISQKKLIKQLKLLDQLQFPYFRCFKELRNRRKSKPILQDDNNDKSIELVVEKVPSNNGDSAFTEKYKPNSGSDIFVNTKPVIDLKKFLSSWLENNDVKHHYSDSSDDFIVNSNSSNSSSLRKAVVLTGPPGCGKTMSVYALANEMNFKVLEINAGDKRTGKKVLKKLQEATQSHYVNNSQCSQTDRFNLVKKSKSKTNPSDDSEDSGGSQKLSLILVEDADVIFEEDIGFIDSINQLIATTKRPVVLISNQLNCAHLNRFICKNTIEFKAAKAKFASKWLSVLSVVERCYITENMCETLYRRNNNDFRKTLLELQIFIQSGGDNVNKAILNNDDNDDNDNDCEIDSENTKLCDLFTKDQNQTDMIVPFPVNFSKLDFVTRKNPAIKKTDSLAVEKKSKSLVESLKFLEIVSTATWLDHRSNSSDRTVNHLTDDIVHFMIENSVKTQENTRSRFVKDELPRKKLATNLVNHNYHTVRSTNLNIEPYLRSICRFESKRSQFERKSSRFYHYLRNANTNSFDTKVFDDFCSILTDE